MSDPVSQTTTCHLATLRIVPECCGKTPCVHAMPRKTWEPAQSVRTPLNIEAILRACPDLLAAWKRDPFILILDQEGRVAVRRMADVLKEPA